MNKERTNEEIIASGYFRQSELKRIYGGTNGARIYKAAQKIDAEELGNSRVVQNMVRITSVYTAIGIKKGGSALVKKTATVAK